ncbi:hypothetical protein KEU06_20985 [Pseudaminobacter sp. 19-2017]|uniref:Uncharacterized protein n=1 Tax=Pseudaminobacter soli (ex Zhang et al. 2022) TaxID=2831468 RepID=A0A942E0G5_9HYPH|nr:hypothetical protein [Pseudaminobacter soli]MBS3651091.1 hypothetical protein [Pseudaminobacter soli]
MSQKPIEQRSCASSSNEDLRVISEFAERNGISVDQARQVTNIFRPRMSRSGSASAADARTPVLEGAA